MSRRLVGKRSRKRETFVYFTSSLGDEENPRHQQPHNGMALGACSLYQINAWNPLTILETVNAGFPAVASCCAKPQSHLGRRGVNIENELLQDASHNPFRNAQAG
jgi:hypothetical protein